MIAMNIKDILSKDLGIEKLTPASLKEAVECRYDTLPDKEKRRINREIAHHVIKSIKLPRGGRSYRGTEKTGPAQDAGVLGINYFGPLDVTLQWKTAPGGALDLAGYRIDSGGDQINVSKVFGAFGEKIALVARTGREGGEITGAWERGFLSDSVIPSFIRDGQEDEQAAVYNIIDGETLPGMFEWADGLSGETVENINRETMTMLEGMFKGGRDSVWMTLSAGGAIRYDSRLACYATLIKRIKKQYRDRVKILIDFKFMAGSEETMSVLDIPREKPQDIIKPNLEEFVNILNASGLAGPGILDKNTISEEAVKEYAMKLRKKYGLLGVLVSMGKDGLILVMHDKIIKEKGVRIMQACPTAAGDSLKAGFLYALSKGRSFEEAVHTGNLFGAGTASMEGSETVTPRKFAEMEALARMQNVVPEKETVA